MKERTSKTITIYRTLSSGTVEVCTVPITSDCSRKYSLMEEDSITLVFAVVKPIAFRLGDWIDDELFGRFEITELQMPAYDTDKGGYKYNLRFDADYYKWTNKICKYIPTVAAKETSFTLTANIATHLAVITRNLSALGYTHNGTEYTVDYETYNINDVIDTQESLLITYSSISIFDALNTIADTFECEWWVDGSVIYVGTCQNTGSTTFRLGDNMADLTRSSTAEKAATRVYFFGSDKNLPSTYREDTESPDVTQDGVVQTHLMLPAETYPYAFIQDDEVEIEEEAVEKVVIFDDIYPRTNLTVTGVNTYTSTTEDEETGETITQTFYRVKEDSDFTTNFSGDMIIDDVLHIVFTSGNLTGMDFECTLVSKDDELGKCFEIVMNDTYGRDLPDDVLHPEVGDTFCLYNWDASAMEDLGLIAKAEEELAERAEEYFEQSKIDGSTYTATLFSAYAYNSGTFLYFGAGDQIHLINDAFFTQIDDNAEHYRNSRVIGFEFKLDKPYDSPQYTLGEKKVNTNILGSLQEEVESIKVNGTTYSSSGSSGSGTSVYIIGMSDNTTPTDSNVYSARRSDQMFLRRDTDDTALGRITHAVESQHNKGAQFGSSFVSGLAGLGGRIDGSADGELNSLSLRSFLEAPEFRFNRVSIFVGNNWRACGGGVIESVTPDTDADGNELSTGTIVLHLEDGEIGKIAVDDICQGIYHDGLTLSNNDTFDLDDGIGNFKFSGYFTSYFRITEILDETYQSKVRYALRNDDNWSAEHHPSAMMHFVSYGNFSDEDRQSSRYSTLTYERYLTGVNTWEFQASNVAAQFGDLSNLSVFGLSMTGYSAYLNNIYMSGAIKQIEELPYRMEITNNGMESLAYGEVTVLTCAVYQGFTDKTDTVTSWSIVRDTGDAAEDAAWLLKDKVKNFDGEIVISYTADENDLTTTSNNLSTLFTITAYGEDGEELAAAEITI